MQPQEAPVCCLCPHVWNVSGRSNDAATLQDMAALLALKAEVLAPDCSTDPRVCAIFSTWTEFSEPCQVPECSICRINATCGASGSSGPTCAWKYIGCTKGRVTRIMLGKWNASMSDGTLT